MAEEPNDRGLAWLLAAKVVCCGGLLLAATGALSLGGVVSWLLDGGMSWLAIAALAVTMFHLGRRRRAERLSREQQKRANASRGAT